MFERKDFSEKAYGYLYYPQERSDSPGHPRLDVFLRSVPTQQHFDPMTMILDVALGHNSIDILKVHHPWSLLEHYRVCAGRVIVQDRKGKKVEAFSFGGDLKIESKEELTIGVLTSPAPILELTSTSSMPSILAEETEILFAEKRAEWEPDHATFNKKLMMADPFTLYCACLEYWKAKYEHAHLIEDRVFQRFTLFIQNEIEALQELHKWPAQLPTIDDLL